MRISFGTIIGSFTALLPAVLLVLLLSVLLTYSDNTHQYLLQLASREVALIMSQAVAAKLDTGYHEAQSAMHISKRIGVPSHHADSPPARFSQSYTAEQMAARGIDKLRYGKNLWLAKETRVMEQYHSGLTYVGLFWVPPPHQLNATPFHSQFTTCRFEADANLIVMRRLVQRGKFEANTQLHNPSPIRTTPTEIPLNVTGFGLWDEQLRPITPRGSRDSMLRHLAAFATTGQPWVIPPDGPTWLAHKELGAALSTAVVGAAASGFRIPVIDERQLRLIDAQYTLRGVISSLNRSVIATAAPVFFRTAQPTMDRLGDARCISRLNVAALLDTAVTTFYQIAGYPSNHYTPFDFLVNEGNPTSSIAEALAQSAASRSEGSGGGGGSSRGKAFARGEPVFYLLDGRGNPIHSTEGLLFARFRSNLSLPSQPHPMESWGCVANVWPKYDGSLGLERIVSCPKNVTDDSEFVLLNQLRKSSDVNVSDFRAAMLAANKSAAVQRSKSGSKAADLSAQFRHAWVTDPRDGTRYEVTIAPLVTEDPALWHYSIVVFTPENFRRGDIDARRNVSIGIAVAICIVAVVATFLATLYISRQVSDIILQMADPIGLNAKFSLFSSIDRRKVGIARLVQQRTAAAGDANAVNDLASQEDPALPFLLRLKHCFEKLEELLEVEAAFLQCRSTVEELRGFVNQDALLLLHGVKLSDESTRPAPTDNETTTRFTPPTSDPPSFNDSTKNDNSINISNNENSDNNGNDYCDDERQRFTRDNGNNKKKKNTKSVRFRLATTVQEAEKEDDAIAPAPAAASAAPAPAAASAAAASAAAAAPAVSALGDPIADAESELSCSSASDSSEEESSSAPVQPALRKAPKLLGRSTTSIITPNTVRFYSCVVVNFPIVQRVASSRALIRRVTGIAAEMCHSLLSRLPVMAIEQFLGDGLICAVHIRNLARPSRTLSTVVEQLIRECGVFEKKVDEIMAAGTQQQQQQRQGEEGEYVLDDKTAPLVAVGICVGPGRMPQSIAPEASDSRFHRSSGSSGSSSHSFTDITKLRDAGVSAMFTLRATTFIGPLVAHAEKLCRERSAVASTQVSLLEQDHAAKLIRVTLAEAQFVGGAGCERHLLTSAKWRGNVFPIIGSSHSQCQNSEDVPVPLLLPNCGGNSATEYDDRYSSGSSQGQQQQHRGGDLRQIRYAIFMQRCFIGLASKPVSSRRVNFGAITAAPDAVALSEAQPILLRSGASAALFAVSRIVGEDDLNRA